MKIKLHIYLKREELNAKLQVTQLLFTVEIDREH